MVNRNNYRLFKSYLEYLRSQAQLNDLSIERYWSYGKRLLLWADETPFSKAAMSSRPSPAIWNRRGWPGSGQDLIGHSPQQQTVCLREALAHESPCICVEVGYLPSAVLEPSFSAWRLHDAIQGYERAYDYFSHAISLLQRGPNVSHTRRRYYPCTFQFDVLSAGMAEQSDTVTEQHGHEVKGRVISPRPLSNVEHSSAHQNCPHIFECFVKNLSLSISLAAGEAVTLAPARQIVHPFVEPLAALA